MNIEWPEFVKESEDTASRAPAVAERTGWETVVFELGDQEPDSDFSTAATAP